MPLLGVSSRVPAVLYTVRAASHDTTQ